jgi:hypothetical protein
MPIRHPAAKLAPLLAALALVACASGAEPAECRSDDQCPAASRCGTGVCVADERPVAAIRTLAPVEAHALVELDASDSHDPDRDDGVVEHLWTIRPLDARCAAPEVAGSGPIARVRFGCPGRYEVSLSVRDALGVESAPATVEVEVRPSAGAPAVIAGPDVSTDHACEGEPLVCRPVDPVTLTAAVPAPGLTLRWSVEPPLDRPLEDGTRRVRLVPAGAAVRATIETDGTAISGDWIFRVEALDAYGVVGAAYTRVSVRNRAPVVVVETPDPFPHVFDAMRSRFTAAGEVTWTAHDPDGDPVETAAVWRHVGDGGASFRGALGAGRATFTVDVPYATPGDALNLRGGSSALSRTIEIFARDPNRGEGRGSIRVEIGNRPPVLAPGAVDVRVPHRFDALRSRYVADAELGAWTDPDGDPLLATTAAAPCDAVTVVDGAVRVQCSVAYEGTPAVDRIAGARQVAVRVRDPWSDATAVGLYTLEILNSPPALAFTTDGSLPTWADDPFGKLPTLFIGAGTFTVFPEATDPDGDPVALGATAAPGGTVTPAVAVCTSPGCVPFLYAQPLQALGYPYVLPSRLAVTDGAASTTTAVAPRLHRP